MDICRIKNKTFKDALTCINYIEQLCINTEKKLDYDLNFICSDFKYDKANILEFLKWLLEYKNKKYDLLLMIRRTGFTVNMVNQWKEQYNNDVSYYNIYQLKLNRNNNISMKLIEG